MDSIGNAVNLIFGNVYPGRFCQSLIKDAFLLDQIVRYHKLPIISRINMGSSQRKPITIDLWYLKPYS